jgi:hypothetical protein
MEFLRKIINEGANHLSNQDKTTILNLASEMGIEHDVTEETTCRSCYIDLAVKLLCEMGDTSAVKPAENAEQKLRIKKGVDIIVNGVRVNRYTINSDEMAQRLLDSGLNKKYFDL